MKYHTLGKSVVIVQMYWLKDFNVGFRKTDCDSIPAGDMLEQKEMFVPKHTKDFFAL